MYVVSIDFWQYKIEVEVDIVFFRSKKAILALFFVLVFVYYIGPKIFGFGRKSYAAHGQGI